MKDSIENKRKFFAQYWNQKLWTKESYDGEGGLKEINGLCLDYPHIIGSAYLQLTPLSMITDEHAIEVGYRSKLEFEQCNQVDDLKDLNEGLEYNEVDFLRSKAYALPYMNISVDEQIKRGWVRLNE